MSLKDREKWDNKYQAPDRVVASNPSSWLESHADLLPGCGRALDLASGEGRNAVFAAQLGYEVDAVDISSVGLEKAKRLADEKKVKISTINVDLDSYSLQKEHYDLILCFNFLERRLFPEIIHALKPGGFVFYETFSTAYLKYSGFKREWVLEENELLTAFRELHIINYREVDSAEQGQGFASLIAKKK
ncbi:MAG: SAM-dependent methyltransferase [Nitrospinae bacterium CG11_big_fil_rev_8_21_14_0_20_45_15]|nr:MAG: SAM-dependent methyltransferase [Nitrospinae bacterium CG11_big_fil_rev_8_21_14_0_20_45_15]